jgi:hypothetical protein
MRIRTFAVAWSGVLALLSGRTDLHAARVVRRALWIGANDDNPFDGSMPQCRCACPVNRPPGAKSPCSP